MSNFITSRMQGRLGNMMFQIAHTYVMSKKYKVPYKIPRHESNSIPYESTVFRHVPFFNGKTDDLENTEYIQLPFRYKPAPAPSPDKQTVYVGWRQSEKFFEGYNNDIKYLFGPTTEFVKRALYTFPEIIHGRVCAINVRRGDYLNFPDRHPVHSKEYFLEAFKHLKKKPDTVLVLSDDLQWCKENLAEIPNVKFIEWYEADALWLLSLCDDFILSNSTFSWWGSFLSDTDDKQIICSDQWFGPAVLEMGDTPEDIYGDDWTIIPCKYEPGNITPL